MHQTIINIFSSAALIGVALATLLIYKESKTKKDWFDHLTLAFILMFFITLAIINLHLIKL